MPALSVRVSLLYSVILSLGLLFVVVTFGPYELYKMWGESVGYCVIPTILWICVGILSWSHTKGAVTALVSTPISLWFGTYGYIVKSDAPIMDVIYNPLMRSIMFMLFVLAVMATKVLLNAMRRLGSEHRPA